MRIIDVDPLFENSNSQLVQLNQLMATAKEPWEVAQYKWRIQNLQNSISAGKGMPTDATGNLKPVVDARTWMKQNPSIVKSLPKEALPPEMQQPGMLDKIGTTFKNIRNNIVDYANRETELEKDMRQNREEEESDKMRRAIDDYNQGLRENTELDRIKSLTSKVLKG